MPAPYSNRDSVIKTKLYKTEDPLVKLKITTSIPKVDVPVLSVIERCRYYHAVYYKKDNDDLIMTDIFSIDLKGYIP